MITWLATLIAYLIENCTGVVLHEATENSLSCTDSQEVLDHLDLIDPLEDFTAFDSEDTIFQEFDPPSCLQSDPNAWKLNRPRFISTFWECLKTVVVIQTVAGTLVGVVAVGIIFLVLSTTMWCYDDFSNWYSLPKSVQRLRVTVENVEGFMLELWDLCLLCIVFPFSLIKKVNVLSVSLAAAFLDVIFRLNRQMFGIYQVLWGTFTLNGLFSLANITNHFLIARHFYPRCLMKTLKLHFIITAHCYFGMPVIYFTVYKLLYIYGRQEEQLQVITAALSPMLTLVPKIICRLAVQNLEGIVHPGRAHVFVSVVYGVSAVMFRMMQAQLTSIDWFVALGIAHAIIDLLERLTITMRDHIWEHLYRLVRRQRSRPPKYRSPRSRRLIADLSIQIMMQETSALVTALGFVYVYQLLYRNAVPFTDYRMVITDFLVRAGIGLLIDLVFNVISLLIQTHVMNIAVNRVWKKKWRHNIVVNCVVVLIPVLYFSRNLFAVLRYKYGFTNHVNNHNTSNCSFPSFLQ